MNNEKYELNDEPRNVDDVMQSNVIENDINNKNNNALTKDDIIEQIKFYTKQFINEQETIVPKNEIQKITEPKTIGMKTVSNIFAGLGIAVVIASFILNTLDLTKIDMNDALKVGAFCKGVFLPVDASVWITNIFKGRNNAY